MAMLKEPIKEAVTLRKYIGGEWVESKGELVDVDQLCWRLVEGYPSHDFIITSKEAAALGLNVKPIAKHEAWKKVKRVYNSFETAGESLVMLIHEDGLEKFIGQYCKTASEAANESRE